MSVEFGDVIVEPDRHPLKFEREPACILAVADTLFNQVLAYLKVGEGDTLCIIDAADGSVRLSPAKAEFTKQMQVAEDVIARYRNTLRELAK